MSYPAKLKSRPRGTSNSPNTTQPSPSATSSGPQGAFFAGAYNFTIHGGMFQNNPEGSVTITYDSPRAESIFTNSFQGQPEYRDFDRMELSPPPMYYDNTHLHTHHDAMNNYPRPFDSHASNSRSGTGTPADRVFVHTPVRPYMGGSAAEFSWGARPPKSADTGRSPLGGIASRASPALHSTKSVSGMVFLDRMTMEPCLLYLRQDEDVVILADHLQVLGNLGLKTTDSLQRYLPGKGFWSDVGWRDPIIVAQGDSVMLKPKGLHVQMY